AGRLAKYGFNIVRLHQMDFHSAPNGIFQRNSNNTLSLDDEQMDKLDYLIYQLKMKGIYVDINLYTGRKFTEADGVVEAKDLPDKYVTLFDPKLVELEKDYARQLLTHYNPYTKTRYSEEPSVAFVEITNEDSLFRAWKFNTLNRKLPPHYNEELDNLWMDWLRGHYADRAALEKAWQPAGDDLARGAKGLNAEETLEGNGVIRIEFAETANYSAQRVADLTQFYYEVERNFFRDMMTYIHNDLRIKVPVSTTNNYYGQVNVMSRTEGDFIDSHAYWLNSAKDPADGFSLLQNATFGEGSENNVESDPIIRLSESAVAGKPFVVSEWNATAPNRYEYELAGLMASYASLQDWDGMIIHMYYNGKEPFVKGYVSKGNETANNPVKLAQLQALAIAFQRGYVKPEQQQLLLKFSKQDTFRAYRDYGLKLDFNVPGKLPLITTFIHGLRKTFDTDTTTTANDLLPASELAGGDLKFRIGDDSTPWYEIVRK
ncbi:MAG: hypothetical protein K0R75_3093, partial [Paenibacillaceae bacterium]|nr:hypothetical protein [Paenibacillaceae bacterium]